MTGVARKGRDVGQENGLIGGCQAPRRLVGLERSDDGYRGERGTRRTMRRRTRVRVMYRGIAERKWFFKQVAQ